MMMRSSSSCCSTTVTLVNSSSSRSSSSSSSNLSVHHHEHHRAMSPVMTVLLASVLLLLVVTITSSSGGGVIVVVVEAFSSSSSSLSSYYRLSPTSSSLSLLSRRRRRRKRRSPPSTTTRIRQPLLQLALTSSATDSVAADAADAHQADAVICGGGPAGLLSSIMLAQKFPEWKNIQVYDRLSAPPDPDDNNVWFNDVSKFYLIGLGGRGQMALREYGVWDNDVGRRCNPVLGRKDWPPGADADDGVQRIFTSKDKHVTTQILPRDKLVGVLHKVITEQYSSQIELNYGYEIHPLDFHYGPGDSQVLIEVAKCSSEISRLNPSSQKVAYENPETQDVLCQVDAGGSKPISTPLLIAADGTVRSFANAVEQASNEDREENLSKMNPLGRLVSKLITTSNNKPFTVKRYDDDNQRVYKTVPIQLPISEPPDKNNWRSDVNFSSRSKDNSRIVFDALPANDRGLYCGVLLMRKDDEMATSNTDPKQLRTLLDDYLPAFSPLLDNSTIEAIAKKPVSYLPGFRYIGPQLHYGNACVMLGDCAHTVKPYFGLGANSALEDVKVLGDIIDDEQRKIAAGNSDGSATTTTSATSIDIASTVREFSERRGPEAKTMVRLSRELDRPGKISFLTFIGPLILDSIFNGLAPNLFQMNVIAMMQREQFTFQQVARRKRFDRIAQLAIVGSVATGTYKAVSFLIRYVAQSFGVGTMKAIAGIVGSSTVLVMAKNLVSSMITASSKTPGGDNALAKKLLTSQSWHLLSPLKKLATTRSSSSNSSSNSSNSSTNKNNRKDESSSDSSSSRSGRDISQIDVTRLVRPRSVTTTTTSTTSTKEDDKM